MLRHWFRILILPDTWSSCTLQSNYATFIQLEWLEVGTVEYKETGLYFYPDPYIIHIYVQFGFVKSGKDTFFKNTLIMVLSPHKSCYCGIEEYFQERRWNYNLEKRVFEQIEGIRSSNFITFGVLDKYRGTVHICRYKAFQSAGL